MIKYKSMKKLGEITLSNLPSHASVSLAIAALFVGASIGYCIGILVPYDNQDWGKSEHPYMPEQAADDRLVTTTNTGSALSVTPIERFELTNGYLTCGKDIVSGDALIQKTDCTFLNTNGIPAYCPGSYRDSKRVYIATSNSCSTMLSLDLSSVRPLSPLYFADANGIYIAVNGIDTNIIRKISTSTSTFEVLDAGFARDALRVYFAYNETAENGSSIVFDGAPESFRLINEYYAVGSGRVWYIRHPRHEGFPEVYAIAADSQSLRPASAFWPELAIDAQNVYLYGIPQAGIDAVTFRVATGTSQSAVASDELRRYQIERSVDDTRAVRLMAL